MHQPVPPCQRLQIQGQQGCPQLLKVGVSVLTDLRASWRFWSGLELRTLLMNLAGSKSKKSSKKKKAAKSKPNGDEIQTNGAREDGLALEPDGESAEAEEPETPTVRWPVFDGLCHKLTPGSSGSGSGWSLNRAHHPREQVHQLFSNTSRSRSDRHTLSLGHHTRSDASVQSHQWVCGVDHCNGPPDASRGAGQGS